MEEEKKEINNSEVNDEFTTNETVTDKVEEMPSIEQDEEKVEEPSTISNVSIDSKNKTTHAKAFGILLILIIFISVGCILLFNKNNKGDEESGKEVVSKEYKSDYRISSNSLEAFDLYFLQLENEKVNKIYSPLSIKYALEMLMEATEGDSKEQIAAVIGDYEARTYTNSENMSFANAMFVKNAFKESIKQDYISKIKSKFNAEIVFDPFESAKTINSWIKNKTLNLLDDIVDDNTVKQLDFALVNALAIDMEWEEKFFDNDAPLKHKTATAYSHEKIPGSDFRYQWIYTDDRILYSENFENINEDISALKVKASFNRYDIISKLGEENIRKTVGDAYRDYINNNPTSDFWDNETKTSKKYSDLSETEIDNLVDEYLDRYIEEISQNYKDEAYITDFSFYVDDSVKVFAKDLKEYNGTTLQYVGIMPTSVSLDSYISNIDASKVNTLISSLKPMKLESFKDGYVTEIDGYVPKFKFDYTLQLKEDLNKLGITDIFDLNKANLSGLTSVKQYISTVEHIANIEFTQYGIKAAAVTMFGGTGAAGDFDYFFEVPYEKIDLTFNKPYMFIIRDKSTGEVWFAGTVYNPLLWKDDTTKPQG